MLSVVLANVWRGTAFSMLVYSAALQDVPPEITEAAEVDGASGFQRFFQITLPMIRSSIQTNMMLITLQTLSVFTLIYVMTAGGPGTSSTTLPLLAYQEAFKFSELGYGTAIATILLLIGAVFSVVYIRALKPEVN
jgi:multiple sugar transport system permease protein